ncbi:hypothetical protein NL676_031353 [Syzygium grande]|nr:hypothetical protein NL676_031353 [Syzygium grande]
MTQFVTVVGRFLGGSDDAARYETEQNISARTKKIIAVVFLGTPFGMMLGERMGVVTQDIIFFLKSVCCGRDFDHAREKPTRIEELVVLSVFVLDRAIASFIPILQTPPHCASGSRCCLLPSHWNSTRWGLRGSIM